VGKYRGGYYKSETRQLTALVGVRFAQEDFDALRAEANRRGVTVPELLRDISLSSLRNAS
jgi:hypothetical protein